MPIDYQAAKQRLEEEFDAVEQAGLAAEAPAGGGDAVLPEQFDVIFRSRTQSYREVLLGCILAKLQDPAIDVHKPYVAQGDDAYNGRTLDERVVNPFLHEKRIPSSRGPFLSTFRRSVAFVPATREGLRDGEGFDALLAIIDHVNGADEAELLRTLRYALRRFVALREAGDVPLTRLQRISLEQYDALIQGLLATPSGGRFPVMLVEAGFTAIRDAYGLGWIIEVQGINAADRAAGAGGDITIRVGDAVLLAAEVTERPVARDRVVATFQTKIAPHGIEEYLFFVREGVGEDVMRQTRQYFAQGHEINFLEMRNWLVTVLATIGRAGRDVFNRVIVEKLGAADVPAALKMAWNDQIARIIAA
jgi:hypothetical protein